MRPIDGDALLEKLNRKKAGPANQKYTDGFNDCLMRVRSMVHSAPTLTPQNEPLTQADVDKMHFDRVWIDYGVDDSGERCGEEGVVLYGKIYGIDTLDGSAFETLLLDACDGETLNRPSGDYTVYRRPPEGEE